MGEAVVRFGLVVFLAGTTVDWWWRNMVLSLFSSLFVIFGFFCVFYGDEIWSDGGVVVRFWYCYGDVIQWYHLTFNLTSSSSCLIFIFIYFYWFCDLGFFKIVATSSSLVLLCLDSSLWINSSWRETTQRNGNKVALKAKNKFS